ncbi:9008_t:CDS:2 [Entrophospora sp. SA101]|nr:9008_t:CDS:2 [Entrophospora sp. SA101]
MSSYYIEEDDSFTTTTNINESSAENNSLASTSIISTKSLPPFERASKTHSAAQPTDLNKRIIQTTANTTPNTAPRKRPKKLPKIDKINGVPIPPIIASIPKTTGIINKAMNAKTINVQR